jgi:hypothetical protein
MSTNFLFVSKRTAILMINLVSYLTQNDTFFAAEGRDIMKL